MSRISRKSYYILIPLVITIWALIIYKVKDSINNMDAKDEAFTNEIDYIYLSDEKDTLKLSLNYRDPFFLSKEKPLLSTKKANSIISKKKEKYDLWPEIQFNGVITNVKDNKTLALVNISGEIYLFYTNETINNVKLLKINNDSIELLYNGTRKKIYKTESDVKI